MPEGELVVVKHLIIPGGKNRYSFKYKFRSEKFLTRDASAFDDVVTCQLEIEEPQYSDLLHVWLPKFAVSFKCYRAQISMSEYAFDFTDWGWNEWSGRPATNPAYHRIKNSAGVDIDGRNNIFTLHPAMFWDEELCINALGFGAAEVERRIKNDASHVELINGGVHIVLSTKLQMSFEDCVEMNEHFGRLLDIGGY